MTSSFQSSSLPSSGPSIHAYDLSITSLSPRPKSSKSSLPSPKGPMTSTFPLHKDAEVRYDKDDESFRQQGGHGRSVASSSLNTSEGFSQSQRNALLDSSGVTPASSMEPSIFSDLLGSAASNAKVQVEEERGYRPDSLSTRPNLSAVRGADCIIPSSNNSLDIGRKSAIIRSRTGETQPFTARAFSPFSSSTRTADISLTDNELASIILTDAEDESGYFDTILEGPSECTPLTAPKLGGFGIDTKKIKPHHEGMRSRATERAAFMSGSMTAKDSWDLTMGPEKINAVRQRSFTLGSAPLSDKDILSWGANFWCVVEQPKGQSFFANPQTGTCAWAVPSGTFVLPPQPYGQWWELYDQERELPYYYQTRTHQTTWECPKGFVIPMAAIQESNLGKRFSKNEFGGEESCATPTSAGLLSKSYHARRRRIEAENCTAHAHQNTISAPKMPPLLSESTRNRQPPPPSSAPIDGIDIHKPRKVKSSTVLRESDRCRRIKTSSSFSPPHSPARRQHSPIHLSPIESKSHCGGWLSPSLGRSKDVDGSTKKYSAVGPPTSFELRRTHRRERGPVKRKEAAAASTLPSVSPYFDQKLNDLTTGEHAVIPMALHRANQSSAFESYAKNNFASHRSGILRRKIPFHRLLQWQNHPITSPILAINQPEVRRDAVRGFKIILRIMGDRTSPVFCTMMPSSLLPSSTNSEREANATAAIQSSSDSCSPNQNMDRSLAVIARSAEAGVVRHRRDKKSNPYRNASGPSIVEDGLWLLERCTVSDYRLHDELLIQTVKQLTGNMRTQSRRKGWQWMWVMLSTFAPSKELQGPLAQFFEDRIRASWTKVGQCQNSIDEATMAQRCLRHLSVTSRNDLQTKAPSLTAITRVFESSYEPEISSEGLETVIERQEV